MNVNLKARRYSKANNVKKPEQPTKCSKKMKTDAGEVGKQKQQIKQNKENVMALSNRQPIQIEHIDIKQYLSNIVKKVENVESRKNKTQNILDELKEEPVGLKSMKSEGGLLKIKRKRSTLKLFNPYV